MLSLGAGSDQFNHGANVMTVDAHASNPDLVDLKLNRRDGSSPRFTLNRSAYHQAWQLARGRAERIRDALGDPEGGRWLSDWLYGLPEATHFRVPLELRRYICEADLETLFGDPFGENLA